MQIFNDIAEFSQIECYSARCEMFVSSAFALFSLSTE